MNREKGLNLIEFAIVLVVLALIVGFTLTGFSLYRERAEYIAMNKNNDLEELIALDKGEIDRLPADPQEGEPEPDPTPDPEPDPEPEPEPEIVAPEPEPEAVPAAEPRWVRWMRRWRERGGWAGWWRRWRRD